MANLNFTEKAYFERLFQMGGGYVLDFSNRTFQEFIFNSIGIDVYKKYEYQSKANLLRRIMSDFNDIIVGKMLLQMLEYKRTHLEVTQGEKETFLKSVEIAQHLIGKTGSDIKTDSKKHNSESSQEIFDFKKFLQLLVDVSKIENAQQRGYEFEKFLYSLFEKCGLEPRNSFKIEGEQIDGSFMYQNEVYLLEAKWQKDVIEKRDLVTFNEKVASKSRFTRGLFISFSPYSSQAIDTFSNGRVICISLMTVQEIAIALERNIDFCTLLKKKIRALAEEGEFFKSIIL